MLERETDDFLPESKLHELFDYFPETGVILWKTGRLVGRPAGCFDDLNILRMCVEGHKVQGARIIWRWMTGEWPRGLIQYRDKEPGNLFWSNLQVIPKSAISAQNACGATNKSGYRGVTRQGNRWIARAVTHKATRYLGIYETPEEASDVVEKFCAIRDGIFYVNRGVKRDVNAR